MALNKAYTAVFGVSTQDFFNFIQRDPSLLAGIPTLSRVAAWGGGFPIKGGRRNCRGDRAERGVRRAELLTAFTTKTSSAIGRRTCKALIISAAPTARSSLWTTSVYRKNSS